MVSMVDTHVRNRSTLRTHSLLVVQALAGEKSKIPQSHVVDVLKYARLGGVLKSAVLDNHIFDFRILKADKIKWPTALFRSYIL